MSPNLITLDTSFEIEDFDPLNQNAKVLPPLVTRPAQTANNPTFSMTSTYNPVYPTTYHGAMAASAPPQALPRRKEIDAESELLQQYGLLSLLDSSSSSTKQHYASNGTSIRSSRKDWTEFE